MSTLVSTAVRRFRDIWRFMIPGNFQQGEGELVQYTEGWFLDAFAEVCQQTTWLMFPSICPDDALPQIGHDRAIPRGFAEPEASYRERLVRWRYPRGHRIRGSAPGLLEQIAAVFGNAVTAQTIDARGTRYTFGTDGAERGVAWDWDGEDLLPNWARFWVVLKIDGATHLPTWAEAEAAGTTWEDAKAEPRCWAGLGIHPGQLAAVKRLVQVGRLSWTPAGRRPVYLVIWFEGESYPAPDGTWDDWSDRPPFMYAFEPLHASIE